MRNSNKCPEIYPQRILKGETLQIQDNGCQIEKISLLNKNGMVMRTLEGRTLNTADLENEIYMIRMDTKEWIFINKFSVTQVKETVKDR